MFGLIGSIAGIIVFGKAFLNQSSFSIFNIIGIIISICMSGIFLYAVVVALKKETIEIDKTNIIITSKNGKYILATEGIVARNGELIDKNGNKASLFFGPEIADLARLISEGISVRELQSCFGKF